MGQAGSDTWAGNRHVPCPVSLHSCALAGLWGLSPFTATHDPRLGPGPRALLTGDLSTFLLCPHSLAQ